MNSLKNITICITGDIDSGEPETIECLKVYLDVLEKYDVKSTIPVTAQAVQDYPDRIEYISKRDHEIAGHGDIHKGFYGSVEKQVDRLKNMINTIDDILDIQVEGFRAPWYKHDKNTYLALSKAGLRYDSSQKRFEIAFKGIPYVEKKYMNFYGYQLAKPILKMTAQLYNFAFQTKRLPYYIAENVVEIPVLGISDYSLIDAPKGPNYSPNDCITIGKIWLEQLNVMRNNSVLVIQAHPGRMSPEYVAALDYFICHSQMKGATFTTLKSITDIFSK